MAANDGIVKERQAVAEKARVGLSEIAGIRFLD
jgi:hypothetical protein